MSLDAPDDGGLRYGLRLARHFGNDRIVVAGSLGYLEASEFRIAPNDAPLGNDYRKRLTADLTFFFDFLRSDRHALRIGGGPSGWYRRDNLLMGYSTVVRPDGTAAAATIQREDIRAINIGYHLTGEYEYLVSPRVLLSGRVSWADLSKGGISSIVGLGVGYRFSLN